MKYHKFSEIIYAIIALIATYKTYTEWNIDRNRAYLFLGFAILSLFMFFFRRHFRKKFEKRKNQNQS